MRALLLLLFTWAPALGSPAKPVTPEIALDQADVVVVGSAVAEPARPGAAYSFRVTTTVKGSVAPGVIRVLSHASRVERPGRLLVLFLDASSDPPHTRTVTDLTAFDEFQMGSGKARVTLLRRLLSMQGPDRGPAARAWRAALHGDHMLVLLALDRVSLTGSYASVGKSVATRIRKIRDHEPALLGQAVLDVNAGESTSLASAKLRALTTLGPALKRPAGRARALRFAHGLADHDDWNLRVESLLLSAALEDPGFAAAASALVRGKAAPAAGAALSAVRDAALASESMRKKLARDRLLLTSVAAALDRPDIQHGAVDALEAVVHGRSVASDARGAEAVARWRQWRANR